MIARAKLILFALLTAAATCATSSAAPELRAAEPTKAPPGAELGRIAQSSLPDLCDLAEGRYCESCDGPGEPTCPQGDSGPLCCQQGVCVAWTGGDCNGDLGWCMNYTTETGPGGIEEATCWD